MKNVLVIAPDMALEHAPKEVQAVVNSGLPTHLLSGKVTMDDVIRVISQQTWRVLWIVSHSTPDGVMLSDGLVARSLLAAYVRTAQVELVYLNTCESYAIAANMQRETGADVICTVTPIDDVTAYSTGALFASNLVKTKGNYRKAYELSEPGQNHVYLYLSNPKARLMESHEFGDLHNEVRKLSQELFELRTVVSTKMTALETHLYWPRAEHFFRSGETPNNNRFTYILLTGLFVTSLLLFALLVLYAQSRLGFARPPL